MIKKLLPHVCIVLGLMMTVFIIINYINTAMNFILNDISLAINLILSVSSVIMAAIYIHDSRK